MGIEELKATMIAKQQGDTFSYERITATKISVSKSL